MPSSVWRKPTSGLDEKNRDATSGQTQPCDMIVCTIAFPPHADLQSLPTYFAEVQYAVSGLIGVSENVIEMGAIDEAR